jgi:hypothetical protein
MPRFVSRDGTRERAYARPFKRAQPTSHRIVIMLLLVEMPDVFGGLPPDMAKVLIVEDYKDFLAVISSHLATASP